MVRRGKKMMRNVAISPDCKQQPSETAKSSSENDQEPFAIEINNLKNELESKDALIFSLQEKVKSDERISQLEQKLKTSEAERKRLEDENGLSAQLIQFQKKLIDKLETESSRMSQVYSKLASSQKKLISMLEGKYNELLHSLIDSFDDIETGSSYESKVEEIQTDLNHLIQILGNKWRGEAAAHENSLASLVSVERPLNDQSPSSENGSMRSMRRILSDQLISVDSAESSFSDVPWTPNYDESIYIDFDLNMRTNDSKEVSQRNSLSSSTIMSKSDFECQCNLNESNNSESELNQSLVAELNAKSIEICKMKETIAKLEEATNRPLRAATDPRKLNNSETDSLEELISSYMELIKRYRQLVEHLDKARKDNTQLKVSYNFLNEKYKTLKSGRLAHDNSNIQV